MIPPAVKSFLLTCLLGGIWSASASVSANANAELVPFVYELRPSDHGNWRKLVLTFHRLGNQVCPNILDTLAQDKVITRSMFLFVCNEAQAWLDRIIQSGDMDAQDFTPSEEMLQRLAELQNLWAMSVVQLSGAESETPSWVLLNYELAITAVAHWSNTCQDSRGWCCFLAKLRFELNAAIDFVCTAHRQLCGTSFDLRRTHLQDAERILTVCQTRNVM